MSAVPVRSDAAALSAVGRLHRSRGRPSAGRRRGVRTIGRAARLADRLCQRRRRRSGLHRLVLHPCADGRPMGRGRWTGSARGQRDLAAWSCLRPAADPGRPLALSLGGRSAERPAGCRPLLPQHLERGAAEPRSSSAASASSHGEAATGALAPLLAALALVLYGGLDEPVRLRLAAVARPALHIIGHRHADDRGTAPVGDVRRGPASPTRPKRIRSGAITAG